jgi:hypothetical protein
VKITLTRKQKIITWAILLILLLLLIIWLFSACSKKIGPQATYIYTPGPNTDYRLQIELDKLPVNPYPGTATTGRVFVMDKQGEKIASANGGVFLHFGDLHRAITGYGLGVGGVPLSTETGQTFEPARLVGNTVVSYQDNSLVERGMAGFSQGWWEPSSSDDGSYDFIDQSSKEAPSETPPYAAYLLLKNGEAEFSYFNRGDEAETTSLIIQASTIETLLNSNPASYQLVPPSSFSNDPDRIATVATFPIGKPVNFKTPPPVSYNHSVTDYYYQADWAKPKTDKTTGKQIVELTIQAKAKPGRQLPRTINDTLFINIQKTYPLFDQSTYPARFADSNKQVLGERFGGFDNQNSRNGGSHDGIYFDTDARPTTIILELTGASSVLPFANLMLSAAGGTGDMPIPSGNLALQRQACAADRARVNQDKLAGRTPEPLSLFCLSRFTYTYLSLPISK